MDPKVRQYTMCARLSSLHSAFIIMCRFLKFGQRAKNIYYIVILSLIIPQIRL